MTLQEIFDRVAKHLLAQNGRATIIYDGRELCAYRGADGKTCAVGCLIRDDKYHSKMEGEGLGNPLVTNAVFSSLKLRGEKAKVVSLLEALQRLHDFTAPSQWRTGLSTVADLFGLNKDTLGVA